MTTLHSLDEADFQYSWMTIGVFDGVHLGHQRIIHSLINQAHDAGGPALVLTFDPHPAIVLGKKSDFKCLCSTNERVELLESYGVDAVIVQQFTSKFAQQSASVFMQQVVKRTGLRGLVIGYDTALGRGREGNAVRLGEIGKELGYSVESVPALEDDNGIITSTRIRGNIAAGEVSSATTALGRPYVISGPVIHGDGRGHRINIPTANLDVPVGKVAPANGIYACWAWVDGQKYRAATNVGVRPTFTPDLPAPIIEAHLLDIDHDLYGKNLSLEFIEYLRPEEKYDSVAALLDQIHIDIAHTREILG